jgi:hypothetical protein
MLNVVSTIPVVFALTCKTSISFGIQSGAAKRSIFEKQLRKKKNNIKTIL